MHPVSGVQPHKTLLSPETEVCQVRQNASFGEMLQAEGLIPSLRLMQQYQHQKTYMQKNEHTLRQEEDKIQRQCLI